MDNNSRGIGLRFTLAEEGVCLNANSQRKGCACSLKELASSENRNEYQEQLVNFTSLMRKWKKNDNQSYTEYVFSQFSLRQKGDYRNGQEDKYFIPRADAQSFSPPDDEALNEMPTLSEEGWICLGFWCFLFGVDKNGVSQLRERKKQNDEIVAIMENQDDSSDLKTWIENTYG